MFKEGDAVRIKPNTTLDSGKVVQDWYGVVEEVLEEGYCVVLLDAPTINGLEDDYLKLKLMEAELPFLEVFKFDSLELTTRRDTEDELKQALEHLTDRAMSLEDELEAEIQSNQEALALAFENSRYYDALTPSQKRDAEFMIDFMEIMYDFAEQLPQDWTPEAIKVICLKDIPGTWITEPSVFEQLGDILVAFLQFLGEENHIQNSAELIKMVQSIADKIPVAAQNKKNWYDPKPLLVEAQAAGIDLTDRKALDAFVKNKKK